MEIILLFCSALFCTNLSQWTGLESLAKSKERNCTTQDKPRADFKCEKCISLTNGMRYMCSTSWYFTSILFLKAGTLNITLLNQVKVYSYETSLKCRILPLVLYESFSSQYVSMVNSVLYTISLSYNPSLPA